MNPEDSKFVDHLNELFLLSIEGKISEVQFHELAGILKKNAVARAYYYDFIAMHVGFNDLDMLMEVDCLKEQRDLNQLWSELLEEERTAPAVKLPLSTEKSPRELIQKVVYEKEPRQFPTASVVRALVSVAAFLLLLAYVYLNPRKVSSPVATMADTMNVIWQHSGDSIDSGQRLYSDVPLVLKEGLVKIKFDYGSQVVVEGPAEIELLSESQMNLGYGRLYAVVPEEASGFIVDTPSARIVDLGTEFGIQVQSGGTSEVHMVTGQASLIPGTDRQKKKGISLVAGEAKQVDTDGQTRSITLNQTAFVRQIDSRADVVWHGQDSVDLADIVGGGNGFGTGRIGYGVSITSGDIVSIDNYDLDQVLSRSQELYFQEVAQSSFIDGVFMPDGGLGKVVVSSKGHVFEGCPDTKGIANRPALNGGKVFQEEQGELSLMMDGQVCGTREHPAMLLHSNAGVTFDLQKIQASLPPALRFVSFKAKTAISSSLDIQPDYIIPEAGVYVLVDGQIRYEDHNQSFQSKEIVIPLSQNDRFLTLITTDNGLMNCDWVLYGRPRLELTK